jgi:hypothetical protein
LAKQLSPEAEEGVQPLNALDFPLNIPLSR